METLLFNFNLSCLLALEKGKSPKNFVQVCPNLDYLQKTAFYLTSSNTSPNTANHLLTDPNWQIRLLNQSFVGVRYLNSNINYIRDCLAKRGLKLIYVRLRYKHLDRITYTDVYIPKETFENPVSYKLLRNLIALILSTIDNNNLKSNTYFNNVVDLNKRESLLVETTKDKKIRLKILKDESKNLYLPIYDGKTKGYKACIKKTNLNIRHRIIYRNLKNNKINNSNTHIQLQKKRSITATTSKTFEKADKELLVAVDQINPSSASFMNSIEKSEMEKREQLSENKFFGSQKSNNSIYKKDSCEPIKINALGIKTLEKVINLHSVKSVSQNYDINKKLTQNIYKINSISQSPMEDNLGGLGKLANKRTLHLFKKEKKSHFDEKLIVKKNCAK